MDEILSSSKFASIKDRARQLIHQDAKQDSHIIKERTADRMKNLNKTSAGATQYDSMVFANATTTPSVDSNMINEETGAHGQYLEEELNKKLNSLRRKNTMTTNTSSVVGGKTHLPKEILETFGIETDNDGTIIKEEGAEMGNDAQLIQESMYQEPNVSRGVITETASNGVDYSLIKTIVESTMKKYLGAYMKKYLNEGKIINENSSELKAIKLGNKFSFITDNGDLYEAKLVFKKNINKK